MGIPTSHESSKLPEAPTKDIISSQRGKSFLWDINLNWTNILKDKKYSLQASIDQLDRMNTHELADGEPLSCFEHRLIHFLDPILSTNAKLTGFCDLPEAVVSIDTAGAEPVHRRQFGIPYKRRPIVTQQVQEWLEKGIIKKLHTHTPWNNPLLVTPKKGPEGQPPEWRICIDPRAINTLTVGANFPLPIIRELLESLSGSIVFTKIDLKGGFHQFKIREEHQEKTAFTWDGIQYAFQGAPFGFKHLPAIFQKTMSHYFRECPFVKVYMDDIIIHSRSFQEHVHHVKRVIQISMLPISKPIPKSVTTPD